MIMDKHSMRELTYKLFDTYYEVVDINDHNLDKRMVYNDNDSIRIFYTMTVNDKIYLSYRKRDRDNIKKLIPISDYMFTKHIKGWFTSKFNVEVYSVLLPR